MGAGETVSCIPDRDSEHRRPSPKGRQRNGIGIAWKPLADGPPRILEFTEDDGFSQDVEEMAHPDLRNDVLKRWSEENERQIWTDRIVPFPHIPPFNDPEIRPNVLFYDEGYGSRLVWTEDFIRGGPDAVLVIGCSGGVTLLPRLLLQCRNANPNCAILNINPHEDNVELTHVHLNLPASAALESIASRLS